MLQLKDLKEGGIYVAVQRENKDRVVLFKYKEPSFDEGEPELSDDEYVIVDMDDPEESIYYDDDDLCSELKNVDIREANEYEQQWYEEIIYRGCIDYDDIPDELKPYKKIENNNPQIEKVDMQSGEYYTIHDGDYTSSIIKMGVDKVLDFDRTEVNNNDFSSCNFEEIKFTEFFEPDAEEDIENYTIQKSSDVEIEWFKLCEEERTDAKPPRKTPLFGTFEPQVANSYPIF